MMKRKRFDFAEIKRHVKELRKNMTDSEKLLWDELRARKLEGYKFLRQHPLLYKGNLTRYNYFIADFYCSSKRVVIEVDGHIHDTNVEYDNYRDTELNDLGIKVLRIKNEELENMKEALFKIKSFLENIR